MQDKIVMTPLGMTLKDSFLNGSEVQQQTMRPQTTSFFNSRSHFNDLQAQSRFLWEGEQKIFIPGKSQTPLAYKQRLFGDQGKSTLHKLAKKNFGQQQIEKQTNGILETSSNQQQISGSQFQQLEQTYSRVLDKIQEKKETEDDALVRLLYRHKNSFKVSLNPVGGQSLIPKLPTFDYEKNFIQEIQKLTTPICQSYNESNKLVENKLKKINRQYLEKKQEIKSLKQDMNLRIQNNESKRTENNETEFIKKFVGETDKELERLQGLGLRANERSKMALEYICDRKYRDYFWRKFRVPGDKLPSRKYLNLPKFYEKNKQRGQAMIPLYL